MQREPTWQPISLLPKLSLELDAVHESLDRALVDFAAFRDRPHVLDDATVDGHRAAFRRNQILLPVLREQLRRWHAEATTKKQRAELARLEPIAEQCIVATDQVLGLLDELSGGTIDRLMGMSDFALAMAFLQGQTRSPMPPRPVEQPSNVRTLLPRMVVNRRFIYDFLDAPAPCFALSLVEERKQTHGFLAIRTGAAFPKSVADSGFEFGHSLRGTADAPLVHFAFVIHGVGTFNVLVRPDNSIVRTVLSRMVEDQHYFFMLIGLDGSATVFGGDLGGADLAGLKTNLPLILNGKVSDAQYEKALRAFRRHPDPSGEVLEWVCRDDTGYLDLTEERMDLTPKAGR